MNRRTWKTPIRALGLAALAATALPVANAQPAAPNYDEARVPPYTLNELLAAPDGSRITDPAAWRTRRRPELLALFAEHVYGHTPGGRPPGMHWRLQTVDRAALGGRATRKEYTVWFTADARGPRMQLLVYQPNDRPPAPVFLGWNFHGNHTVHPDPGISLPESWVENNRRHGITENRATASNRGAHARRWPIERILERGYAVATAYRGDMFPDHDDGWAESAARVFGGAPDLASRSPTEWGAVGVWAWSLSRALDVLLEDPELDARRTVVHGHSRLGKAALWAGAQDERFAIVISNCSGAGGAALSKRIYGETVAALNHRFPYWFCPNFRRYDAREADLPVDQHELLALIAPRPLYVASATEDQWADPRGEFLAAAAVDPVYALFGRRGLGTREMPGPEQPVGEVVRYHIREGEHDILAYDWEQYLDFADRWLPAR